MELTPHERSSAILAHARRTTGGPGSLPGQRQERVDLRDLSPFEAATGGGRAPGTRSRRQLRELSARAERRAAQAPPGALVLVALQHVRCWTPRTRSVYERLAAAGAAVVAFGVDLPASTTAPAAGRLTTVGLEPDDVLADEWLVLVRAGADTWGFVAREAAAGLPAARPAVGLDGSRWAPTRLFRWSELTDAAPYAQAESALLTRLPLPCAAADA